MIERYLGEEQARDIFVSSMLAHLMTEKQAESFVGGLEKAAYGLSDALKDIKNVGGILGGVLGRVGKAGIAGAKFVPSSMGWLAALGAGTGVLGATAYDVVKERVSHEDPEAELNADIEALYNDRTREIADSKWMDRVRLMRDDLKRNYKKLAPNEYAKRYQELLAALDEKKEKA